MNDLKKLNKSELEEKLRQSQEELRNLRFQAYSDQLKQVHQIKNTKKLIARILTLLNSKQYGK